MGKAEGKIQKKIIDYINDNLGIAWRNNSGILKIGVRWIHLAPKGSPDIVACIEGKFIGIECKTKKGKVEAHQIEFGERIARAGGQYIIARSLEEFRENISIDL